MDPFLDLTFPYKGVCKNGGTPKWMVKIMEIPMKLDDLGIPPFSETPHKVMFAMSRTVGWVSQWNEMVHRLSRPEGRWESMARWNFPPPPIKQGEISP